jgi:hypothetical protein
MTLKSFSRLCASTVFLLSLAFPALADCQRYECKRTVDTATCWLRYGPLAHNFALGSECSEGMKCIWFYTGTGWGEVCNYNCTIDPCYEV